MQKYSKDEMWKIFEVLPPELKRAVFSEETADSLTTIYERNDMTDQQASAISTIVGYVLMRVLSPKQFAQTIASEMGLSQTQATNVAREINQWVFTPIQQFLQTTAPAPTVPAQPAASATPPPPPAPPATSPAEQKKEPPKFQRPILQKKTGADSYREPIS